MTFDAVKSKLYSPIMNAIAGFFGLGESATESEVHEALVAQTVPLATLLENVKTAAVEAVAAEMLGFKERLATLETEYTEMKAAQEAKDASIAELQLQVSETEAANSAEMSAVKTQHASEIKVLAGQVSALKAGKPQEQDESGDAHPAGAPSNVKASVMPLQKGALSEMVKRARAN